jgi:adenylate kinase
LGKYIFFGAPGAGKGTQAVAITAQAGIPQISSGDLFRAAQKNGTELGLLAKAHMEKGQLVPDEVTVRMVLERISQPDCKNGYILDGFPRTLAQARALDKALAEKHDSIDKVVYIKVTNEELIRRLSGRLICRSCQAPYNKNDAPPKVSGKCDRCGGELYQRADDSENVVRSRLETFLKETAPLIDYYQKAGKLAEVNGEIGMNNVTKEILKIMSQVDKSKSTGKK